MDFKELAGSRCAPVSLVPACFDERLVWTVDLRPA
jgi:hypothetical protein